MPSSPSNVSPADRPAPAATASPPAAQRSAPSVGDILRDYVELTKPEISFLVTVSALAGFLLGSPQTLDGWALLATLTGVVLCAGGVGVLNHVFEMHIDAQMKRTADRPLPDGRVNPDSARYFGIGLICTSVGLLCPLVNALTAVLAALTAVLYLFVYTPLKQKTRWNTVIGTVPGALPALGGYTAATGDVGAAGWALFAVLAFWQMPHFYSLAWMYRKDYARGNYAMLPVLEPNGTSTAVQMIVFTVLLIGASVLPTAFGASGWIYAGGVVPLGLWFLWTTIRFYGTRTGQRARHVLKASIYYIPALVVLLGIDWMV
jgi:protoheme IX farnesyltransferase